MKKVLITDKIPEAGLQVLREGALLEVDVKTGLDEAGLIQALPSYDGVVIRSGTRLTAKALEAAVNLKVVGRAGVGVDNVDVEAATRLGIIVMNTPDGNTKSTCEHTVAMLMALARKIPAAVAHLKAGGWERAKFQGVELHGKTLGVVGLGRIGTQVAIRAKAFGMKIVAADPFMDPAAAKKQDIELASFDQVLRQADFLTVHSPLTPETKGMIGKGQFGIMKKGVRVINCARGGIVDEAALLEAIVSGKVAGAALDVFVDEPPTNHPLLRRDEVIATPHLGASTVEAQENVAAIVAKQVRDFLLEGIIQNALNVPKTSAAESPHVTAHLRLAEAMGQFLAQIADGYIQKVRVECSGEAAELDTRILVSYILKGILSRAVKERVNYVNARLVAKERGIEVVESTSSQARDFRSLVYVKASTQSGSRSLSGTVLEDNRVRIARIDGYETDVVAEGLMLVFSHTDKPGILGRMGTLLGQHGVNIASLHLGRDAAGGNAVAVMNVDSEPGPEALKGLRNMAEIRELKVVRLEKST